MKETAQQLVTAGKGIMAADLPAKRFAEQLKQHNVTADEDSYRVWCELLVTAPRLSDEVSGVILAEDAVHLCTDKGQPLPDLVRERGMIPGITPSGGLVPLAGAQGEVIGSGLDGLRERFAKYAKMGFGFSKWRAPVRIAADAPSDYAMAANAYVLAQFAALSQEAGIVPMVEPEVELLGDHTIERCFEVTEALLRHTFAALYLHRVELESALVKASMVLAGADCPTPADVDAVAELTVKAFRRGIPAAIPGIAFLSGGQNDFKSAAHLNAMNANYTTPWALTFSYARALHRQAFGLWRGQAENAAAAQAALKRRAKMNSLASVGEWSPALEKETAAG